MITYSGHVILPDVLNSMSAYLRYFWVNARVHSTPEAVRMFRYGIITHWKPLLWFVKETRGDCCHFVSDVVSGPKEKSHHEWQQSETDAAYYIKNLTSPTGLVVDFFAGSGTTCVAAE